MSQRQGLGQGLSCPPRGSKPDLEELAQKSELTYFSPEQFVTGLYQPRQQWKGEELEELAESLKTQGILHPLLARYSQDGDVELIAGERRLRAALKIGLKTIPCRILKISEKEALEVSLLENIQRSNLNAIDEAQGYQKLIDTLGYTQDELAKRLGKSRSHITNTLRLPCFLLLFNRSSMKKKFLQDMVALCLALQIQIFGQKKLSKKTFRSGAGEPYPKATTTVRQTTDTPSPPITRGLQ